MKRKQDSSALPMKARQLQPGKSPWPLVAVVLGVLLVCFSIMTLDLAYRTLLFWLSRDDYILTELKVTDLEVDEEPSYWGIVAATGEEIHFSQMPTELIEYSSPSDPTGTVMLPETARGKVIPIWFAQNHTSPFSSRSVQFVSEHPSPPSGTQVLSIAAVGLAIFTAGAGSATWGIRRAMRTLEP